MAQSSFFGQSILDYNAVADKFENFNYDYTAMANKPCINGHKLLGGENTLQYLGITDFVTGCVTGICERTAALEAVATEHAQYLNALAECVDTKSTVTTSSTGTSTEVINYITVDGCEKLLPGGAAGVVNTVNNKGPVSGNVTVTGSDIAVGESCATLVCDKIDAIDVSTTSLNNAVDNLSTSVESLATAVSSKSTVSVSTTGSATDEVCYITINGTEHKLAGGVSPGPGPSPSICLDIFNYEEINPDYPDASDIKEFLCHSYLAYINCCVNLCCTYSKNIITNSKTWLCDVEEGTVLCTFSNITTIGTVSNNYIAYAYDEEAEHMCVESHNLRIDGFVLPNKVDGSPTAYIDSNQKALFIHCSMVSYYNPDCYTQEVLASEYEYALGCPEGSLSVCTKEELTQLFKSCCTSVSCSIELHTFPEFISSSSFDDGTYAVKIIKSGNEFCTCLVKEE